MEALTGRAIRDFKLRGNFVNQHNRRVLRQARLQKPEGGSARWPGYSPPVVEFVLEDGTSDNLIASASDIPRLCQDDYDLAKEHLALILNARRGNGGAASQLAALEDSAWRDVAADDRQPTESTFAVPCTSAEPHSEREISQKGFILLKLMQMGYPVPDFVILTEQAYAEYNEHLEEHLAEAIAQLEILTRQSLGHSAEPLVFAIRCATPHYIPGVMDTYLNVGVTESTLPCVESIYGTAAARKMFLNNLRNLCECLECEGSAALLNSIRWDLSHEEVARAIDQLISFIRKKDPKLVEDPFAQAAFIVNQAYKHYEDNYDLVATLCRGAAGHNPSLILQKMVCTVRHDEAYAGVMSSRHTQTGVGKELQTARNIFGEEMMTGTADIQSTVFDDPAAIKDSFPGVYHFVPHLAELEQEFESPVTIEFAVEATRRYQWFALLQLNEAGLAGRAAVTSVVDMHKSGVISRKRVTELIRPYHIKQLSSDTIDQENFSALKHFCSGVAVLPRSAVSARVYFSGEAALTAKGQGEKVCLCKKTFVPTDTVVMREMDAILSLTSAAIHVVTICQSLGIPAILSLEKNGVSLQDSRLMNAAGRELKEGEWITISSRRRAVYEGQAQYTPARLLRYMRGEEVRFDPGEKEVFDSIAYAFRYYQQLIKSLKVDQISTLDEITRLVNFELRAEPEEAGRLVNSWFDERETRYVEEVLKSDIGDHLAQSRVFEMLTLNRRIKFFKKALAKCAKEQISGYEVGAFMVGRFLSLRYPVAFWKPFTPVEIGLLVNEWVLFEKYMQVLYKMGERKVLYARKKILKEGLDELHLHPGNVQALITLKLSGVNLDEARHSLPAWTDPQSVKVLELLQQPYRAFYDFSSKWSVGALEKICEEEKIAVPGPDDV